MSETIDIQLPTVKTGIEKINPTTLAIFGLPKCGKTTALATLEDCLIIDTEDGSSYVEALKVKVPEDLGPVAKFEWLRKVARKLKEEKKYKYVAIDTLTMLDEWSEWVGTYKYMNSVQGASFNRQKSLSGQPIKGGTMLKPTDAAYESVNTIPEGYGYRWSREAIMDLFTELAGTGTVCTIFVCHVAEKMISKGNQDSVRVRDLALTGKVKDIISRKVDAVGYVYNEDGKIMISFKGNEDRAGGIRSAHIRGYEGELDWKKIFI